MINNDEFTTCPYDASHRVLRSRMPHHLIKCQKKHPVLLICPFNATHRYPESELKTHCASCPNRHPDIPKPMVGQTESIGAITAPKPILQTEYLSEIDPENECWDD